MKLEVDCFLAEMFFAVVAVFAAVGVEIVGKGIEDIGTFEHFAC